MTPNNLKNKKNGKKEFAYTVGAHAANSRSLNKTPIKSAKGSDENSGPISDAQRKLDFYKNYHRHR